MKRQREWLEAPEIPRGTTEMASTEASRNRPSGHQKSLDKAPITEDWGNTELKENDLEVYNKFNSCYRFIQLGNVKSARYWLTQIQNSLLACKHASDQASHGYREARMLVLKLAHFFSTSRSDALELLERNLFGGATSEQRQLRNILSNIETADLVNVRVQDFLNLLRFFKIDTEKTRALEAVLSVQDMLSMYQQHIIGESDLLSFFEKIRRSDEEVIPSKNQRPI